MSLPIVSDSSRKEYFSKKMKVKYNIPLFYPFMLIYYIFDWVLILVYVSFTSDWISAICSSMNKYIFISLTSFRKNIRSSESH